MVLKKSIGGVEMKFLSSFMFDLEWVRIGVLCRHGATGLRRICAARWWDGPHHHEAGVDTECGQPSR